MSPIAVRTTLNLNLGCGRKIREGFVNVDVVPGPGVDLVWDLDAIPWPFEDGSADRIFAEGILEHVLHFDRFWREIYRVLRVGGRIEIGVPYGFNTDPWHVRYFNRFSILRLTVQPESSTNLQDVGRFRCVEWRVTGNGFPWWHLSVYLNLRFVPFHRRNTNCAKLWFTLERTA